MTQCPIATHPLLDSRGMTEQEHREMLQRCGLVVMIAGDLSTALMANSMAAARGLAIQLVRIYRRPAVILSPCGITEPVFRTGDVA